MNKQNHTLEELLRAAREEQPVVSFSETAEQIGRLEHHLQQRKHRRGIAWLWEKAFAFPLQTGRNVADAISNAVFAPNPVFTRLASGIAVAGVVILLFPELVHDTYFANMSGLQPSQNLALQASEAEPHGQTQPAFPHSPRIRKYGSQGAQSLALAPLQTVSDSAGNNKPEVTTPESPSTLASSTVETSAQPVEALRNAAKEAAQLPSQKQTPFAKAPFVEKPEQTLAAAPEAANERTFWQRLSFDARVATRTSLAAPADASAGMASATRLQTFKAEQQLASEAASPLQNIALGVMYALDGQHSIGVEGGTEPFLAVTPTSTAQTDGSGNGGDRNNPGFVGITSTPSMETNRPPVTTTIAETRNRAWFGAAYQYSFPVIETLGGLQPLTRITLGGGEIGFVSRAIIGVRFLPQNQVSVLIAGEGAGIARQNGVSSGTSSGASSNATWEFVPKLGMTLGLAVKF